MYIHVEFEQFHRSGYIPAPVEFPKESYRLMDARARLALKGQWVGRSSRVSDPRDLLRRDSEAPWLLRFACAASRVRGL